jgi:D-alanyl-D-alanine carboxypeptidase
MKKIITAFWVIALVISGGYYFLFGHVDEVEMIPTTADIPAPIPASPAVFTRQLPLSHITPTQCLKLVNRTHGMNTPSDDTRLVTLWPTVAARDTTVMLHETAFNAVRDLITEARDAGFDALYVASGYRTREEQAHLYANAADKRYVMPAGHSEHHLGLAADILMAGETANGKRGAAANLWLAENAPRFGLVLRYPEHKQSITEVAYEPWHFRYVGRVHAYVMALYDFVLEEYIEFLQGKEAYALSLNGKNYTIMYQHPKSGALSVPDHDDFTVSVAYGGSYVITAWEGW